MNIRWRIAALIVQFVVLLGVSYVVTGKVFIAETWFFAGLLAVAINPQLLEPFYPRPGDVIANSIIFLLLYGVTDKTITALGWDIFALVLGAAFLLAIVGVLTTAERGLAGFGRAARALSQIASAQVIYSIVFFLSAIEFRPSLNRDFWIMVAAWGLLVVIGRVNWQSIWASVSGSGESCIVEGMIGPSVLLVSAPKLPEPGSWVSVGSKDSLHDGLVLKRISRKNDVWGQIHLTSREQCEKLLRGGVADIVTSTDSAHELVGSVDSGSSDKGLRFVAARTLEIGNVVGIRLADSAHHVIYQLASARINQVDVKGGSHLLVQVDANQLGVFDSKALRFRQHLWVPNPGAAVFLNPIDAPVGAQPPDTWQLLGYAMGTTIPIFLDSVAASEGHVAILGMTKMGKTTLAERIAKVLSKTRNVTILDLTGEYVGKKGFPAYDKNVDMAAPGLSVFEPKQGEVPADRALSFLEYVMKTAMEEYLKGVPFPRTMIIDEAHQFIPEPAGLGFNSPGRDSSFRIGLLLMQVRKYGISVILISQRTAVVAKSALSQCENLIAFRSVDQTGLDYLEAVAGGNVRNLLPGLKQGHALAFGPAVSSELPVVISIAQHDWENPDNDDQPLPDAHPDELE